MNRRGGGDFPKSTWHSAKQTRNSFVVGCDVVLNSTTASPQWAGDDADLPPFIAANEQSKQFVKDKLHRNVNVFKTELFNENWYERKNGGEGIMDALERLMKERKLAPRPFKGRDASSSGIAGELTMDLLKKEILEFRTYIEELEKYFTIRAFWFLVHGAEGEHDWHPDSFVADATHRFILSLGCSAEGEQTKSMAWADFKSVANM